MFKLVLQVRCFKKDHLSSWRKSGNLTGIHRIWRCVWMRITFLSLYYRPQRNSQSTREDEVATKCSSRWSRRDWQLTAASLVGFDLDIVVPSACRVNCLFLIWKQSGHSRSITSCCCGFDIDTIVSQGSFPEDIVVSSAASTAPLFNIVTRLVSMYFYFCSCEDVDRVELKTLSDRTLSFWRKALKKRSPFD